ncbi:MAG: ATP-binding protein involved in chromosome partitioning, partial [Arcticibacterium sp.]
MNPNCYLVISKEDILDALSNVEEPDLKKDLVTLNMVKDVAVEGFKISFTVVLTTPACPLKELIRKRCMDALEEKLGTNIEVDIAMTAEVTTIRNNNPQLPGVKNIIAISSGKGGVGKSTITANLALALKDFGAKVGIIDADIFGPSIPLMFGAEDVQPLITPKDGKNMIHPVNQFGIKMISIGFLTPKDNA